MITTLYIHTGILLTVKEYDFTAQPTFSEGDIFNDSLLSVLSYARSTQDNHHAYC